MNWGILAFVIIYEVLTVVGVGLVIARKNKHSVEERKLCTCRKRAANCTGRCHTCFDHAWFRTYLGYL